MDIHRSFVLIDWKYWVKKLMENGSVCCSVRSRTSKQDSKQNNRKQEAPPPSTHPQTKNTAFLLIAMPTI